MFKNLITTSGGARRISRCEPARTVRFNSDLFLCRSSSFGLSFSFYRTAIAKDFLS
jgi:hypothetical protein